MVETESGDQKKMNKNQGQHSSQNSEADDLHEKLRMVSARSSVRCKSTNNFEELDQGYI